jgi:hypothetical protein
MDQQRINEFCKLKQYVKNMDCTLPSSGGKYKSMTLREFISYKFSKEDILKPIIEKKNSIDCFVLYRVDYKFTNDYNILIDLPSYETRIKLYSQSTTGKYPDNETIHPNLRKKQIINFMKLPQQIDKFTEGETWGQEPSIGINTSFNLNTLYYYANERTEADNKCILYKFYFPISDDINVCVIPQECQWTHITCDEYVNKTFDLIAHENEVDNPEINILDNGRTKLLLAECYSVKIQDITQDDTKLYTNFVNYELLKNLIIPSNSDIRYYMKYLKYKQKYLELKIKK